MAEFGRETITTRLRQWNCQDSDAWDRLMPDIYDELRAQAQRLLAAHTEHTLSPTELIHELYLRFKTRVDTTWKNRQHFFATVALSMRQILVDEARRKKAEKRGGPLTRITTANVELIADSDEAPDIVDLDLALEQLEEVDPAACRIIELTFFAGLNRSEVANVLDISERTVYNRLTWAKTWIAARLAPESHDNATRE
ncbi:MAG: sigma-70 family RNA polymerase sigma factor [Pseudomonadales bacterium]|nr:sigma-70 family RNA polymerase sigma factor [Pseudomonadales bacterium]